MTIAPPTPAIVAADVEEAVNALRGQGFRASAARRLVLEALFQADRPLTAEELAEGVPGRVPRSDVASVYRNLETLEEVGLVRHVHLGHGPGRYALAGDVEHEYLVCEHCGAARAVPAARLSSVRKIIREEHGFLASFRHFPIVGLCGDCLARETTEEEGR